MVADGGGRGRRVSERTARNVGRALPAPRARRVCSTALRRRSDPARTPRQRVERSSAAPLRMTAAEIAGRSRWRSRRSRLAQAVLLCNRSRLGLPSRPTATSVAAPASSSTSTSRSSAASRPASASTASSHAPKPLRPPLPAPAGIRPRMVDDHTPLAYAEVLPDAARSQARLPAPRAAWFARHGVRVERVMTDNGALTSPAPRAACRELGLATSRTRPYRPRTNGKAERFIQTLSHESAYSASTHQPTNRALPAC